MSQISQYWPEYLLKVLDFTELAKGEDQELKTLQQAINRLFDDHFVLTSSLEAIKRREDMLGIQADPSSETLDFRKKRIINRYSTKPPFTLEYLQQRLDFLVGKGRGSATVDPENFILKITAAIDDAGIFKEVERTVYTIKPANLIYQQETAIGDTIALQEDITMQKMNRLTRLGTWALGTVPFAVLEEEVRVK